MGGVRWPAMITSPGSTLYEFDVSKNSWMLFQPAPEPSWNPWFGTCPGPGTFPEPTVRNLPRNPWFGTCPGTFPEPVTCRSEPAPEPSRNPGIYFPSMTFDSWRICLRWVVGKSDPKLFSPNGAFWWWFSDRIRKKIHQENEQKSCWIHKTRTVTYMTYPTRIHVLGIFTY